MKNILRTMWCTLCVHMLIFAVAAVVKSNSYYSNIKHYP
jgi:hypothetical protein